jgi:hypothetical protein
LDTGGPLGRDVVGVCVEYQLVPMLGLFLAGVVFENLGWGFETDQKVPEFLFLHQVLLLGINERVGRDFFVHHAMCRPGYNFFILLSSILVGIPV